MVAEEIIPVLENNQFANTQLIKYMELNPNKSKKSIQEINNTIKKLDIRTLGIPEGMERETGLQGVFNEIVKEDSPTIENKRREPNTRRSANPSRKKKNPSKSTVSVASSQPKIYDFIFPYLHYFLFYLLQNIKGNHPRALAYMEAETTLDLFRACI